MTEKQPSIIESNFNSQFPTDKFDSGTTWTKQGSSEDLEKLVNEASKEVLNGEPSMGVIKFEILQDGGYEVKYFKSRT